jgi:hypothetical protein
MNRKTWIVVGLVALLALGVTLSAGAQGKKMDLGGQRLGFIFNIWDFGDVAAKDGDSTRDLNAGIGLKYWIGNKSAVRALLDFDHYRDSTLDITRTFFGLSGAFEYHFKTGKVSPYTGGLAGVRIQTGDTSDLELALGGLLGVEVRFMDVLGLFGEYTLQFRINDPETWFDLGAGNGGSIGVVVYLP